MLEAGLLALGAAVGWLSTWREICRYREAWGRESQRVEHLLGLLARKEAPAEQAWYQSDLEETPPAVPEDALWDDSGLFFTVPSAPNLETS